MSILWTSFGFVLGAVLGSFVKALADRSLLELSFGGRSFCPRCKKKISWYDLFPIFSYFVLRGKCRNCHKKISFEYPLTELIMAVLVAYLFFLSQPTQFHFSSPYFAWIPFIFWLLNLAFKVLIICVIVCIAITDLKETLIPDRITYPAITIAFLYQEITTLSQMGLQYYALAVSSFGRYFLPPYTAYHLYLFPHWFDTLQPFLGSLVATFLIGIFFLTLILATKGRGMGGGDLKLGIFFGLAFGFPQAILAIMAGFVTGSVAALALIIGRRKKFGQTIPFGPFLSVGALITLFWGPQLMKMLNWT